MNNTQHQCNQCGGDCLLGGYPEDIKVANGLLNAKVRGQYGSQNLEDMIEYQFSLCEKCLVKLFQSFQIPPKQKDYLIGE